MHVRVKKNTLQKSLHKEILNIRSQLHRHAFKGQIQAS